MIEFFEYKLKKPFVVNINGAEENCTHLKIYTPENNVKEYVLQLTQFMCRAVIENARGDKGSDNSGSADNVSASSESIDPKAALAMLLAGSTSVTLIESIFKKLLLSAGTVMLPGGATLNSETTYNKLSLEDSTNLLGAYIANFIISSVIPTS